MPYIVRNDNHAIDNGLLANQHIKFIYKPATTPQTGFNSAIATAILRQLHDIKATPYRLRL